MSARQVVVVGYDGTELLDLACVTSTLDAANVTAGERLYDVRTLTPGGRPVSCDSGLRVAAQGSLQRERGPLDTVVVCGGRGHQAAADDHRITSHVRRLAAVSRRVASVCTGASVLAAAGLLDGRRVATHWAVARDIAGRYPAITVDPDPIFIRDREVITSAGITSALDLSLALVEEDHGDGLARRVARNLVTYRQRPGSQAQVSAFVQHAPPSHPTVRAALEVVDRDLHTPLDAATLARRLGVGERQLHRLFTTHLGQPPGRYLRRARTDRAAELLVTTRLTVAEIAERCGFGSPETLRVAFLGAFEVSPAAYRRLQAAPPVPPRRGREAEPSIT